MERSDWLIFGALVVIAYQLTGIGSLLSAILDALRPPLNDLDDLEP